MSTSVAVDSASILVTGGAGFIGSHLVAALLQRGARRVVVVDSLRYGSPRNLPADARLSVVKHTLGYDDAAVLREAASGVDCVFHLAAEKHNQSKDDPERVYRSNIVGTHQLCDAACQAGAKKIVFSSSLYAYGRMHDPPFAEHELPRPRTAYGISKLAGEHVVAHVAEAAGAAHVTLRYMFVYGPKQFAGMGYRSVIVKNFERIVAGLPPTVYGDGRQALDYVFVDDVVDATLRAMERDLSGETLNIGSGVATEIGDLVDRMLRVSASELEKSFEPPDWTAGSRRVADVTRAAELLGWRATTPLDEGLRTTLLQGGHSRLPPTGTSLP
jgi:UDP-glucose 4-epimerase